MEETTKDYGRRIIAKLCKEMISKLMENDAFCGQPMNATFVNEYICGKEKNQW